MKERAFGDAAAALDLARLRLEAVRSLIRRTCRVYRASGEHEKGDEPRLHPQSSLGSQKLATVDECERREPCRLLPALRGGGPRSGGGALSAAPSRGKNPSVTALKKRRATSPQSGEETVG
jgi:hypothetical protein